LGPSDADSYHPDCVPAVEESPERLQSHLDHSFYHGAFVEMIVVAYQVIGLSSA
jgi:hypothetical protein